MARKIVHAITGEVADEAIRQRTAQGFELFGGAVLTEREVVYSKGIKRLYMPYAEIVWAYRQTAESHVTLGCCGGVLQEFRVVMVRADGKRAVVSSDREAIALRILEEIGTRCPQAAVGFTDENKTRFARLM